MFEKESIYCCQLEGPLTPGGGEGGGGMREWEEVHAGAYILFLNHFLG